MSRREAILGVQIAYGTRAMGGYAGTVSFNTAGAISRRVFSGTPSIILTPLQGSTAMGRTIHLGARAINRGSFTWRGSPAQGTFLWTAMRSEYP